MIEDYLEIDGVKITCHLFVGTGKFSGHQLMREVLLAAKADEAVRIARLARAAGAGNWIKVEVVADNRYLLPDNMETLKATEMLVREGFVVFSYKSPDLSMARRLAECGAAIAISPNPVDCARAFNQAVDAGRIAFLSGMPASVDEARASSPLTGFLREND